VLERLIEPDQQYLFAALRIGAARTGGAGEALTTAATNPHLRDFTHWVNEYCDLQGPSAEEAATRLADFAARAQYQEKIALDKNRLLRIMKKNDPAIYSSEYITCVHNAATTLCEKAKRSREEHMPDHGGCLPLACRNVALTTRNAQAWKREFDRIETRLAARPPQPPLEHTRLAGRRDEIAEFLARTTAPPETAP